uniref:Uncharacterized protein n=1 Tax=Arundo donax TaxID=35708 RepID=A0A0A9TCE9_ARUDO
MWSSKQVFCSPLNHWEPKQSKVCFINSILCECVVTANKYDLIKAICNFTT